MEQESAGNGSGRIAARVHVYPRREILDPQGKAISEALVRVGFDEVAEVRAGKSFDLILEVANETAARDILERICEQLLANPIVEDYSYELHVETAS